MKHPGLHTHTLATFPYPPVCTHVRVCIYMYKHAFIKTQHCYSWLQSNIHSVCSSISPLIQSLTVKTWAYYIYFVQPYIHVKYIDMQKAYIRKVILEFKLHPCKKKNLSHRIQCLRTVLFVFTLAWPNPLDMFFFPTSYSVVMSLIRNTVRSAVIVWISSYLWFLVDI